MVTRCIGFLSTDSKVRTTLHVSIIESGSENLFSLGVKGLNEIIAIFRGSIKC